MMQALREIAASGEKARDEDIDFLSPYRPTTSGASVTANCTWTVGRKPGSRTRFSAKLPVTTHSFMTAHSTISTTYFGDVDTAALERLELSCETNRWLTAVDFVDRTRPQHHDPGGYATISWRSTAWRSQC
jgi:hypothetical protein